MKKTAENFCCQTADESDTLRFNETTQKVEVALYINEPRPNSTSPRIVWTEAEACPFCGDRFSPAKPAIAEEHLGALRHLASLQVGLSRAPTPSEHEAFTAAAKAVLAVLDGASPAPP